MGVNLSRGPFVGHVFIHLSLSRVFLVFPFFEQFAFKYLRISPQETTQDGRFDTFERLTKNPQYREGHLGFWQMPANEAEVYSAAQAIFRWGESQNPHSKACTPVQIRKKPKGGGEGVSSRNDGLFRFHATCREVPASDNCLLHFH